MTTIPAPKLVLTHEEWPDADFDLPEGEPIHSVINRDDDGDEDWDVEMDLGSTGGAKVQAATGFTLGSSGSSHKPQLFNIRPPQPQPISDADDDDDEGVSTIKASAVLPKPVAKIPKQTPIEEDIETAFALPDDLTQLSLAPLSLNHRSSKNSLEWGDKDHTSSSQSSDAYSSLSFADASPSNSASSVSQPDTGDELETDEDDEGVLDGLLIPTGLFDTGHSGRKLNRILELKKKVGMTDTRVKIASPDPEDDFEMGLVIGDDVDLSPSRLLLATHQNKAQLRKSPNRSTSAPPRRPAPSLRPPSRLKHERAKSPVNPPPSSTRQLQKLRLTPSPPLRGGPVRAQTFQALSPAPTPPSSFLSPKPGSLRGQKSHSGLKPPTPPSTTRKLTRKASLSSLMETSQPQAPGFPAPIASGSKARYEEATYASRAKSHKNTTSRIHDYKVPPTRPCTPSNQAALRLTMPTQRSKSRPALSTVWGTVNAPDPSTIRSASPLPPPRPPSSLSLKSQKPSGIPQPVAPKVLRRPKRQRTYGDGTELDSIEDLPADREKEARYRVQPKGYGNRIPGGTYPSKATEKGTVRKKGRREASDSGQDHVPPPLPPTNTLKRTTSRIDSLSKTELPLPKKKRNVSSPTTPGTRRKPTLIRNLGGVGAPKVVGDMKWNPQTLRWEGNDHVLRDFDAVVGTSTRPALITHLTGSSIGSPVGSFASGARIVGNMIFDPSRMCWISTLPPEEDEPDVFANLADDEEDAEDWETKGGTIRASLQGKDLNSSDGVAHTTSTSSNASSEAPSPSCSRTRAMSDSGSDRGSRASMVCEVDDTFLLKCRQAEERHRTEMKGWKATLSKATEAAEPDRSYLYEIRALATRKY
ncbi:hypothetical protein PC9H_003512 [Pleurotus ostreatus]|uniref:Protein byr4 n=1 Tax=Pleurotus ostreatus TaxID=5322 RepID=A0A8H7A1K9_PLEOS|nr:uncharacterized protein PC9H_003512 [Pleurotus ostreatus]KAF7436679.1 hypothetical protein PC9H_003512 [Pleurotus ostreatus]KAJ8702443.1 hypothetical protein PTI98_001154 [Pleurotus ostreatus]